MSITSWTGVKSDVQMASEEWTIMYYYIQVMNWIIFDIQSIRIGDKTSFQGHDSQKLKLCYL